MRRFIILSLIPALLSACQPGPFTAPVPAPTAIAYRADQPVLIGRVMAPGFTVKATSAQVVDSALVALIDGNGVTQAGGSTNAAGAFTLFPVSNSFVATDGAFYTLRVSRRLPTGGSLSLHTTVKLVGTGWTSITGTTVVVNLTTTAIARIDAEDVAVTPELTMAKVSGVNFDVLSAIGAWSVARLTGRVVGLTAQLTDGTDAGGGEAVTYAGNYTITDATSLANFKGYTAITGNLTVTAPGLAAVNLPNLTTIGGNLTIDTQASLTQAILPSLQTVTGALSLQANPLLATVGLSSLTSVGSTLTISGDAALTSLAGLSGLTSVGTALTINNNAALTTLGLTALLNVAGAFTVTNNGALPLVGQINPLRNVQLQAPLPTATTTTGNAP
ncbi:MAG: hypothetical protein H7338_15105 [Candidatus Sericytochromatia bacterium]|nr:hypothetical protein [Candidatus Sericytochromatia bacterium]